MIPVDTSVLMAIVHNESGADACIAALEAEESILISASTVVEALVVAARRNVGAEGGTSEAKQVAHVLTLRARFGRRRNFMKLLG